MPAPIGRETKEKMVTLRALDYSKSEIAEKLDISRHTVRTHLTEIREDIEQQRNRKQALINFLADDRWEAYDDFTSVQSSDDSPHVF